MLIKKMKLENESILEDSSADASSWPL